jgi:hypothetical protein
MRFVVLLVAALDSSRRLRFFAMAAAVAAAARAERLELPTCGFGIRCSTN